MPSFIILGICLLMWLWGNHRKVDIDLLLAIQLDGVQAPRHLALTIYDSEQSPALELDLTLAPTTATASRRISLRPGHYTLRGIVTDTGGQNHIVQQTILVPDQNATMEIFLRR